MVALLQLRPNTTFVPTDHTAELIAEAETWIRRAAAAGALGNMGGHAEPAVLALLNVLKGIWAPKLMPDPPTWLPIMLRVLKLAVARIWSMRALDSRTSRRAICRFGCGILRNSSGLVRRGSRLMNFVVRPSALNTLFM